MATKLQFNPIDFTLTVTHPKDALFAQFEYRIYEDGADEEEIEIIPAQGLTAGGDVYTIFVNRGYVGNIGSTWKAEIRVRNTDNQVSGWTSDTVVASPNSTSVPEAEGSTPLSDYVLIDGTREMTDDWDIGPHQLTAETFESDVTTGTPPLIVASTTLVDNLNADLLDGSEEAVFSYIDGTRNFTGVVGGVDPTASNHLATKEYVDQAVSFIQDFFYNDDASDIGGIYFDMIEFPTGEGQSTFQTGPLGAGAGQALTNWATIAGVPGVNIFKAGVYIGHIHAAKTAGTKPVTIYYEIYTRTHPGGVETLRTTSEASGEITGSNVGYELHATVDVDIDINVTDRIIVKWLADVGVAGSNATVTLYAEGVNSSSLSIPTSTEVLSSVFVRRDGTTPLSAPWDAEQDITAPEFIGDVTADWVQFDTSFSDGSVEGRLQWNSEDGTLEFGLPGGVVVLQIGQETVVRATNKTGSQIDDGAVVYISGAQGSRPTIALAQADSVSTTTVIGVATEDIADNANGYVTTEGLVRDIDTDGMAAGSLLYLSATVAGEFTTTKPTSPDYSVCVGHVLFENVSTGLIFVNIHIIPTLMDLSDVFTEAPSDNDILQWDAADARFELTADLVIDSVTASGTVQAEHLYSTDDAVIDDDLRVGSAIGIGPALVAVYSTNFSIQGLSSHVGTVLERKQDLGAGALIGGISFRYGATPVEVVRISAETSSGANDAGQIEFATKVTTGSLTTRMVIDEGGNVGIGLSIGIDELLHLQSSGETRLKIEGGGGGDGWIQFLESGDTGFEVGYDGGDNFFYFKYGTSGTFGSTALAIDRTTGYLSIESGIINTSSGNLELSPAGDLILDPVGNDVLPETGYDLNLGSLQKKYLTLHAAELWVETLVAQDTIATIGGRILVGPTTVLTSDLGSGATSITVKHNQMASGDRVYMEADGKVEFMSIDSGPGGGGPYTYDVTRNLDGTGANQWYAGDAMFNTGTTGDGFIDLYSYSGVTSGTVGPTIVGNVRNSGTYNDWSEHWAIGNLNGIYGYGSDTYGLGLGEFSTTTTYVTIDSADGYRIFADDHLVSQWEVTGAIKFFDDGEDERVLIGTFSALGDDRFGLRVADNSADDSSTIQVSQIAPSKGSGPGFYYIADATSPGANDDFDVNAFIGDLTAVDSAQEIRGILLNVCDDGETSRTGVDRYGIQIVVGGQTTGEVYGIHAIATNAGAGPGIAGKFVGRVDLTGDMIMTGTLTGVTSITASGTVQAEHLYSIDDAVIDGLATIGETLETGGHIIIDGAAGGADTYLQLKNNTSAIALFASDASISAGSATDVGIFVYGNNNLDFWTNSGRRWRIDGAGDLSAHSALNITTTGGINAAGGHFTASLDIDTDLNVDGNAVIDGMLNVGGTYATLIMDGDTFDDYFQIRTNTAATAFDINNESTGGDLRFYAVEDLYFRTASADPAVKIFKSGNVNMLYSLDVDVDLNVDGNAVIDGTAQIDGVLTLASNLSMAGLDIGSTSAEIGNVYLADNSILYFGSTQEGEIKHSGNELTIAATDGPMYLMIQDGSTFNFVDTSANPLMTLTDAGATGNLNITGSLDVDVDLNVDGSAQIDGGLQVDLSILVGAKLQHVGDADTFIHLTTNQIQVTAGGGPSLYADDSTIRVVGDFSVTSGDDAAEIGVDHADTNTLLTALSLRRGVIGGVGAASLGAALDFDLESDGGGTVSAAGRMGVTWTDATATAEAAQFEWWAFDSGALEPIATLALDGGLWVSGDITSDGSCCGADLYDDVELLRNFVYSTAENRLDLTNGEIVEPDPGLFELGILKECPQPIDGIDEVRYRRSYNKLSYLIAGAVYQTADEMKVQGDEIERLKRENKELRSKVKRIDNHERRLKLLEAA